MYMLGRCQEHRLSEHRLSFDDHRLHHALGHFERHQALARVAARPRGGRIDHQNLLGGIGMCLYRRGYKRAGQSKYAGQK